MANIGTETAVGEDRRDSETADEISQCWSLVTGTIQWITRAKKFHLGDTVFCWNCNGQAVMMVFSCLRKVLCA
jgi:hypothetical protein